MKSAPPRHLGISQQIILIVLLVIVFITACLSSVVGVTSFNNLATITLNELDRLSKSLSAQMHGLQQNAADSLLGLEANTLLSERIEQLTNLGPYYIDSSMVGRDIEESDRIYSLQSQIEIIQALQPLQNLHHLSSISLYHLSPFNLIADAKPVLSIRMDTQGLWVGQFKTKGAIEQREYYYVQRKDYIPSASEFFDVSSVYQLTVQDFYQRTNFEMKKTEGFDEVFSAPPMREDLEPGHIFSTIVIRDSIPFIKTWGYFRAPISNPETWEAEMVPAMLVVIEQAIDAEKLQLIKQQLGIDVALIKDGEVLVSSLPTNERLEDLNQDKIVSSSVQDFYFAGQVMEFKQHSPGEFKAIVLSPISILADLTRRLFIQMGLLALLATLLACLATFWAISRHVSRPLNRLMEGVEKISEGELQHQVKVGSNNELGQLASAFNIMSFDLGKKTEELQNTADSLQDSNIELKRYQMTLEDMVEQRTIKLKETQKQLIESEKMASLGELVAGVAHEINTPVGIGVTAASFLSDEANKINEKYKSDLMTREDFDEFLGCSLQTAEMILSNLKRATELVKSFKLVAVDQTAEDQRVFTVSAYVEDVLVTLNPRLKQTSHIIKVTGDTALDINSYPGAFSQIITNLIMNSVIHAYKKDETGHIAIDIQRDSDQLVLTYSDDGQGVSEETLAKIFDPFFTTKRGLGGSGLGMHIVYNLVTQKLRGLIKCESTLGEGIKFIVTIPLAEN
jgi:signal transduction histidine kinase